MNRVQATAMFLLLFTANGIFEPLEVALNRAWGVTRNRSYLKNQVVSLGLIFACGGLALISLLFTAMNTQWISASSGFIGQISGFLASLFFKLAALAGLHVRAVSGVLAAGPIARSIPSGLRPSRSSSASAWKRSKYVYLWVYRCCGPSWSMSTRPSNIP